jgi:hypothetical protein
VTNSRYTAIMADEQRLTWEPDELQKVLAARHAEFDEQYKLLMARLEKPLPVFEPSFLLKQIDANLKALQDLVRSLPPRNSISG